MAEMNEEQNEIRILMTNQRLRNLTTGILHTKMEHIYEDLEIITGQRGLMTHMLPRVMKACEPWLRDKVKDPRFWDGKFDTTHTGNFHLPEPSKEDRDKMFEIYLEQRNPLFGKNVAVISAE